NCPFPLASRPISSLKPPLAHCSPAPTSEVIIRLVRPLVPSEPPLPLEPFAPLTPSKPLAPSAGLQAVKPKKMNSKGIGLKVVVIIGYDLVETLTSKIRPTKAVYKMKWMEGPFYRLKYRPYGNPWKH